MEKSKERYQADKELEEICARVRDEFRTGDYQEGRRLLIRAMEAFPESPKPHNLMGILLEKERNHVQAMKHFRIAYALDPSYEPARHNLELYGGINPLGQEEY